MRINAKPMASTQVIDFDAKDIIQVYKGRLDICRCGCGGDYFKPGEDDDEIDRALNYLRQYSNQHEVVFERFKYKSADTPNELYLEFETHTSWNGSAMEDESRGYAFYIKDIEE